MQEKSDERTEGEESLALWDILTPLFSYSIPTFLLLQYPCRNEVAIVPCIASCEVERATRAERTAGMLACVKPHLGAVPCVGSREVMINDWCDREGFVH